MSGTAPGLWLRLVAMTYEAVLLFGIAFAAGLALLALAGWTYPLPAERRWLLQAVVFVAVGAYFVYFWARAGQTLAMKSWRLRVAGPDGRPPGIARALARYVLAWSLFAPGLVFAAVARAGIGWNLLALAAGLLAVLSLARFDRDGRLLHDRLTGTRVIRE